MNTKGIVLEILPVQSGTSKTGKDWQKLEFVIETNEQFSKKIAFTLFGDKLSLLAGISIGESVDVHFNLESREFEGRWFHNINAWRIDTVASTSQPSVAEYAKTSNPPNPIDDIQNDGADDLPF